MKKNFVLIISILLLFIISCGTDHSKVIQKMLEETNEKECKNIMGLIETELFSEQNYKWNGKTCDFIVSEELENQIDELIKFHELNHIFNKKNGKADKKKYENWNYYMQDASNNVSSQNLTTECILCWARFDNISNSDKKEIILNSYLKNLVETKQSEFAEINKQLDFLKDCKIALDIYGNGSGITVGNYLEALDEFAKLSKNYNIMFNKVIDGNDITIFSSLGINSEKLDLTVEEYKKVEELGLDIDNMMTANFTFTCNPKSKTCYISKASFGGIGQEIKTYRCNGGVLRDPAGAGYCIGMYTSWLQILINYMEK